MSKYVVVTESDTTTIEADEVITGPGFTHFTNESGMVAAISSRHIISIKLEVK